MLRTRPSQAAIIRSYETREGVHEGWREEVEGRKAMWEKRGARVRSLAPEPGRALDVGAGFGDFLVELQGAGWHTTGTEVSTAAIEEAEGLGVDEMRAGQLDEIELEPESFDLISLWHVLEHLPQPGSALRDLAGYLRPGGLLVIAVPNDGFFPRLAGAYARRALQRRRGPIGYSWRYPAPGEEIHLSFFSSGVLARAVRSVGLRVLASGIDDHFPVPSAATDRRYRRLSAIRSLTRVNVGLTIFLVAERPAG
jgi:SAM-dependent methyltransferase